ncbi:helix-turn-helix domain-containing protein [Allorhizocola rhizosphaerae]|uniref:helix-turn-helix domain-containing protein n=1 Tax=Allorhizocola rhizosphaerae TaxID=1872709 RepID=UPI000E3DCE93|nr:helix-turn-helix transcriptional regulator [Allorhizocola rhizosphaerae]
MARQERPLTRPDDPVQAFAAELRLLRDQAGTPKYLQMARQTGKSRTALAEAAGGDHLPTWETVAAFVAACGADPGDWLGRWEILHDKVKGGSRSSLSPPATTRPDGVAVPAIQRASSAEILIRLWQEQRDQARQLENQRALFCGLIIGLAAAFTAAAAVAPTSLVAMISKTAVVVAGLFGALVSAKFYERHQMHMTGAATIRSRLHELFPDLGIEPDWADSRSRHQRRYRRLYHLRLHHMWVALNLLVALMGLVYLVMSA